MTNNNQLAVGDPHSQTQTIVHGKAPAIEPVKPEVRFIDMDLMVSKAW